MNELADKGAFAFRAENDPPDVYDVMLNSPGLALDPQGALTLRSSHRFSAYLHLDYPRRPPVITWQTPVFHPNLLGPERNGGVCIGSWSAAESLADLCLRLRELVGYKAFNPNDALNLEAAAWTRAHEVKAGSDVSSLIGLSIEDAVALEGMVA
jgi:hypothetical protein